MNVTTYRCAEPTDLPLLAELNRELIDYEHERKMLSVEELEARLKDWLRQGHTALLFENNEQVLGYVLFCLGERIKGEKFIFLRHFLVRSAHRRRGIGREVFHHLLQKVWPSDIPVVLDVGCGNRVGRAFWNALGFQEVSLTLRREPQRINEATRSGRSHR